MYKFIFLMLTLGPLFLCSHCTSIPDNKSTTQEVDETPPKPLTVKSSGAPAITIDSSFNIDYIMGKFEPAKHPDFLEIPIQYADRGGLFLRKDVFASFVKMYESAKAAGIQLKIRSATRNFNNQKRIWEGKWKGTRTIENGKSAAKAYPNPKDRALKILEYSSMPGTSRHHWGTDIDLNNFTNEYFEKGKGLKEYNWLVKNAAQYGFCQVYSEKNETRPSGYQEEKWHWSYLPVAKQLTELAKQQLQNTQISGFEGSATATTIKVVENYILGINPACTH